MLKNRTIFYRFKFIIVLVAINLITFNSITALAVTGPLPYEARAIIYKVKEGYENKVLVGYDEIEKKMLVHSAPKNTKKPVPIGDNYYLARSAIRSYSAVTDISFDDYIDMSSEDFGTYSFNIVSDQPYQEYYECGPVYETEAAKELKFTNPMNERNNANSRDEIIEINRKYEADLVKVFSKMVETEELHSVCTQITDYSSPVKRGFFKKIWLIIKSIFSKDFHYNFI